MCNKLMLSCNLIYAQKITFSQNSDTYKKTERGCSSDCVAGVVTVGDFTGYKYCCQVGKCNDASALSPRYIAIAVTALLALVVLPFARNF